MVNFIKDVIRRSKGFTNDEGDFIQEPFWGIVIQKITQYRHPGDHVELWGVRTKLQEAFGVIEQALNSDDEIAYIGNVANQPEPTIPLKFTAVENPQPMRYVVAVLDSASGQVRSLPSAPNFSSVKPPTSFPQNLKTRVIEEMPEGITPLEKNPIADWD